ncbi:hypothetical protein P8843_06235 [Bacillus inaquosorum]|uniref:hypothetical protein n=3 Tax=Bacillus inaquosorum TaxID=483913 RepID=UPI0022824B15|nr:hypothetical protein [Bacillus inaquosorum]MCY7975214.1 hypothetical protein [Bacillus inaquosorum]MCY8137050.1 hypothetical protein [Bacillus inaquosorum]MCY8282328.1 hypothetical protein [Bacillus inaquosorum]MCY8387219.1 hypothetical protein [Bacillus inaquosorum]MCY8727881.1 hypothetical protein [Bacillus inaquosorum]
MMDIENELFELYMEVKKVKKFKSMFLDSPFIKKERAQEKNKIYLLLFCKLISCLVLYILCWFFLDKYLYENKLPYTVLLLASFFTFCFLTGLSVNQASTKFALLAGFREFHLLKKKVVYEAFEKRLRSRNFTVNQIEKYLLPYLKSQNEDRLAGSTITFLKNIIPTIFVSIITSFFALLINTAVREPNLKQEDFDVAMVTWISLGIQTIVMGAFMFKLIHHLQGILDYKKNHKLLETLFYNYLLKKDRKP